MESQSTPSTAGILFVITGPSGAGKDSVIEKARELGLHFATVTTTTSRTMRPGESEGHPYYFVTQEEFEKKIDRKELLEWAEVYGNYYGSTRTEVEQVLSQEPVVVIKIDPQGARTFKEMMPESVTIFIAPPSVEFLRKRLEGRATDPQEVIEKRLDIAQSELEQLEQWDYVVANEEGALDEAARRVIEIIQQKTGQHVITAE